VLDPKTPRVSPFHNLVDCRCREHKLPVGRATSFGEDEAACLAVDRADHFDPLTRLGRTDKVHSQINDHHRRPTCNIAAGRSNFAQRADEAAVGHLPCVAMVRFNEDRIVIFGYAVFADDFLAPDFPEAIDGGTGGRFVGPAVAGRWGRGHILKPQKLSRDDGALDFV
jgi:hypothetical protein